MTTQPREQPVPCGVCRRSTWNISAYCDAHQNAGGTPSAKSAPHPPTDLHGRQASAVQVAPEP